jgi:hypothetical protein
MTEYEPPIVVPKGELICNAAYFNKVSRAPQRYNLLSNTTKVCLSQVLAAGISLVEELAVEGIVLPNTCNWSQAQMLAAQKAMPHDSL